MTQISSMISYHHNTNTDAYNGLEADPTTATVQTNSDVADDVINTLNVIGDELQIGGTERFGKFNNKHELSAYGSC